LEWGHIKLKKVRAEHPQPPIPPLGGVVIEAMSLLSGDRINNNGIPAEIPFTSILTYMNWRGIENQDIFLDIFKDADRKWVEIQCKKISARNNPIQIGGK
jgi:hypothetical protein